MAKNSRQDLENKFGNGIAPISTKNSKKTTKKVETKKKTKKEDKKKKKKKSTPESTKLSELVKSIDSGNNIAKEFDTEEYNKQYNSLTKKQKAKENERVGKLLSDVTKNKYQENIEKARSESNPILSKSFDEQLKRQRELTFNPSMEDRMNIKENYGVSSEKNPYSKNYDKSVRENAVSKKTKKELDNSRNNVVLADYLKNYYEQENQNPSVAEKIIAPFSQAGTLFTGTAKLMGYQQYKDSKGLVHYLPDKLDLNYEKTKEKINSWVGKELYDTAGSATKILASEGINFFAPGGGTALYWASMAGDNVGEATNKLTAKGQKRYDKVALNAAFKTYLEYWSGKTLGSATKGLTGGKFSELDTGVTNAVYNLLDKLKVPDTLKFKIAKGVGTRFSEGSEEFMQHPLENIIDIVTLGDDGKHDNIIEMLKDPETWLGALKAFGQGAATAGIVEDVNVAVNPGYYDLGAAELNKKKKSKNVQKIIDAEMENRIENEYNGNISAKEEAELQKEIISDIEKGYISTDTIEKTLGGKTYTELEKINTQKNDIQKQIDELERKAEKNELESLEEKQKLNDLKEQIKTIDDSEIRNKLNQEIQEIIKDDLGLQESYKEIERKKEYYTKDISTVENEKAKQTYQNAINAGLNNTNAFHEFVDMMAKISEDKGIVFDFTDNEKLSKSSFGLQGNIYEVTDSNGNFVNEFKTEAEAKSFINKQKNPKNYNINNYYKSINGYVTKDGIKINVNSQRAINRIVGHEITHTFEGTKLYDELKDSLKSFVGEKYWDSLVKRYERVYSGVENANPENELISDLVGDYIFTDENFVRDLSVKNKTVFDKLYDQIKYLYNVATAGSKQRRKLEKVKKTFDKVYNEVESKLRPEVKESVTKESITKENKTITENSEDEPLTQGQIEKFKNSKAVTDDGQLWLVHHGTKSDFTIFDINKAGENGVALGNGFYFTNNKGTAYAFTEDGMYGFNDDQLKSGYVNIEKPASREEKTMSYKEFRKLYDALNNNPDMYIEDMEMSAIDVLLSDYGDIYNNKEQVIKDFYNSYNNDVDLIDNLSNMYNPTEMYKVLRDVTGYDGIIVENPSGYDAFEKYFITFNPDQFKLATNENPTDNPDIRFSITKDNKDHEIPQDMQIIMKDSKARDAEGRLKQLYHGTATGEFYTFDKKMANPESDWGKAIYLTDNETDVNTNYEDGGADFDNKIDRLAEQIEQEENISFDEAKEKARAQLYKGGYKITAYANIKNPAIVGETKLFQYSDEDIAALKGIEREDYDTDEDYDEALWYARSEQIGEDVDSALWEVEKEYDIEYYKDEIMQTLYELADNEDGIEIQELKDNLGERIIDAYDEEGRLISNDIARIIIESQGYDGIIDPTVSHKWNMDMEEGTTHYLAFYPNQVKDINNEHPTTSEDIRYSISVDDSGKVVDDNNIPIEFYRVHTGQYDDNFDYNLSKSSHNTGYGYNFTNDDTYTKNAKSEDITKSTITTQKGLLQDTDNVVSKDIIDKLNDISNKYIPGMIMFNDNMTEAQLIDNINKACEIIADNKDNQNYGRQSFVDFYNALDKDGYIKTEPDGTYMLSVVSKNSIDSLNNTNNSLSQDSQGRELSEGQQEYFKDSKVRDENGNLKVMYHGTNADFNVFDKNRIGSKYNGYSRLGRGFYFVDKEGLADFWASEGKTTTYNKNIKQVYLNMTNPFDSNANYTEELSYLKDQYPNYIDDFYLSAGYRLLNQINKWKDNLGFDSTELLQKLGYDGVIGYDEVAVFEPNQIKNVDNLNPTSNEDIRYSLDIAPISKNFLTEAEQDELDGLRAVDNSGFAELTPEEQSRMYELENRANTVLDKKAEKMLRSASYKAINTTTKIAENYLDFDAKQKKDFRNQMREFSNMTKDELINAETYNKVKDIVSQYANREYTYFDDTVEGIKKELKHTKIKISDELKNQITDYGYFVRDSKLMLRRNSGTPVDQVYQEYSDMYPNFFDSDVWNEADQLERLNDFINHDFSVTEKYTLSDDDLRVATDLIYNKLLQNSLSMQDLIETEEILDKKVQKRTRTVVREELLNKMGITPETIQAGKDISAIDFARTDPIRVNEKVFGWKTGQLINDATVNFAKHQEAEKTRFINSHLKEAKETGIKARSKFSEYVQKYGEKQYVDRDNVVHPYGDAELARDVPNAEDRQKIKNAANLLRQRYDEMLDQVNPILVEFGYDEIPKRKDYMMHFTELADKFSEFGLPFNKESMMAEDLPTDINGLTEFNRPGRAYFANAKPRTGLQTTYDAITGYEKYVRGISEWIFHTETIQRYRALSRLIRETYGREHGYDNVDLMTDEELAQRVKDVQGNKLTKYAAWLDKQANTIANKKSAIDRIPEEFLGRRVYTALNTLKSQVGSNMTGFNVRSAMTNFASAIQGASKTQKLAFVKGTVDTINNIIHNDGMIDKSDFLTRRFGTESLSMKPWQKLSKAGQIFMEGTDYFTANQIWRGKYNENLMKGMSEQDAIKNADDFAARIMGDRSKGSTAEIFNSKTLGLLTQFQLEVNNQWSSLIHDNKMDIQSGNKTPLQVTFQLGQLFAASYMFNTMMKSLTGSDVMIDPIDMLLKIFKKDDDDDSTIVERAQKVLGDFINDLPFASIFTGGRIPIGEAFKGITTTAKKFAGGTDNYGNEISWEDVGEDFKDSIAYWLLPTGWGQIKKTTKGLSMYDDKLPIAGSYTKSGNLRFSAEDNAFGKVKAGLFGQYSSKYAQDYIDSGYKSINSSKLDEMKDLDMNSTEYREYRQGLNNAGTSVEDKLNYISDLDVSDEDKTIMASNVAKKDIDMSEYKKYGSYEEFNYAQKNPAKYETMKLIGGYDTYKKFEKEIEKITADYDRNGKAINNSRKNKVIQYVNSLNLTKAQKAMLIKEQYPSFTQYDSEIASYVNNQNMSFIEKAGVLKQLGFKAYDKQIIEYIKQNYKTVAEQEEELKKLGFKVYYYNGKAYVR